MELYNEKKSWLYIVNPYVGSVSPTETHDKKHSPSLIKIPVKIFIDSVNLNMFCHSSISKRNNYMFQNISDLNKYESFQKLLELVELEVFPIKIKYIINLVGAYFRRWREVIVYIQAYILTRKGLPIYDVEEEILKNT